jgi:hypothetical protein
MSIAICFPLSWKLLIYALETLFVASDKTPAHLVWSITKSHMKYSVDIPARVRFPLRVKLVLRAPVPAYILDNASPFSAHNSRWYDHNGFEFIQSIRERRKYCSRLVLDKMSCTKFVRSRLIPKYQSHRRQATTIERRIHTSRDNLYG